MREKGFTLIELLIVAAVIGLIASIAIPAFLDGIERARQKRTMGDVRTLAMSVQAFRSDYTGYPSSAHNGAPAVSYGGADGLGWLDAQGSPVFIPDYIQAVPQMDGWSWPLFTQAGPDSALDNPDLGEPVSLHYVIWSTGSDIADGGPVEVDGHGNQSEPASVIAGNWCQANAVPTGLPNSHCYQTDICWTDSGFAQVPGGKQRIC